MLLQQLMSAAFNAALVVFAVLLINVNSAAGRTTHSLDDLRTSLHLAVDALQNLGGGVRLVERCRKYLQTLVRVSSSSSELTFPQKRAGLLMYPTDNNTQSTGVASNPAQSTSLGGAPNPDEKDSSPLGLDLGEFLTEDSVDFLTGLVGTSQSMFDMPIQGY